MVVTFTGLTSMLKGFGFTAALIHEPKMDHTTLRRIFWLNFKLSALIGLLIVAMAPILSWFYKEPKLTSMTLLITLGFFVSAIASLHLALLRRQMRFGIISLVELASLITGATVGIILALFGASYWALVFQMLFADISQAALSWLMCRYRPLRSEEAIPESDTKVRSILSYGKNTIMARLLGYLENQFDHILVGRFAGTAQLGLYQKAFKWSNLPVNQFFMPVKMVAISTWSRLQSNPAQYRSYARMAFLVTFSLTMPAIGFLFIEVHDVILLLLGAKWMAVVPIFKILAVLAFAECVSRITKWIYLAEGQTKRRLLWMMISTPLKMAGMVLGIYWGAFGIATGYTVATCILAYPSVLFCLKTSLLNTRDFWAGAWRPALTTLLICLLFTVLADSIPKWECLPCRLAIHAGVYVVFFGVIWITLPGGLAKLKDIIKAILYR
jgi:PST family polysaccharide transporter